MPVNEQNFTIKIDSFNEKILQQKKFSFQTEKKEKRFREQYLILPLNFDNLYSNKLNFLHYLLIKKAIFTV